MQKRVLPIVFLIIAFSLVIAGCSGNSSTSTKSTENVSQANATSSTTEESGAAPDEPVSEEEAAAAESEFDSQQYNELTREKAAEILQNWDHLQLGRELYISVRFSTMSSKHVKVSSIGGSPFLANDREIVFRLENLGLIKVDRSAASAKVTLTEKGDQWLVFRGLDAGSESLPKYDIHAGHKIFDSILGISPNGNTAVVEYGYKYEAYDTGKAIFDCVGFDKYRHPAQSEVVITQKILMRKYDDGWKPEKVIPPSY